jgi:uncharacterized phage-associated protein
MIFKFDKERSIAAILFIVNRLGSADLHKISKVLYYADQKHLIRYGTPITGDFYCAFNHGPVPSRIYDIFKSIRGDSLIPTDEFDKYFTVTNRYNVKALIQPDLDELSESDIECLTESLKENDLLGFKKLSDKSHSKAYHSAELNGKIDILEIAKEGGANSEMIKYIRTVADNMGTFC